MPRYSELKRELRKVHCLLVEEGKEHEKWYSPITQNFFRVSRHDSEEVPPGTEHSIRKKAGIPKRR